MAATKDDIKLSATVLLLRDGAAGLEVFMVQRHHRIDFATGALVFPGGKVDPGDEARLLRRHCRGVEGLEDAQVTARVAAIRETFEESGVLLARPRGTDRLVDASRLAGIEGRFRDDLHADRVSIGEMVEAESLELACDLLVPFAHWITPEVLPKRFDTWFYLVEAPVDQVALHDGKESVDSLWTSVEAALSAEREGKRTIIFPTLVNLRKLGRSPDVRSALAAARADRIVTVLPNVSRDSASGELQLVIREDAGYDMVSVPLSKITGP